MRSLMLSFCLGALVAAGCRDNEVCNPGLTLVDGVCVPATPPWSGGPIPSDAGATATDGDASADAGRD
jgi:hypothetical protein